MKKIVASILTLTLVLTAAIAVSAAPNVTGKVTTSLSMQKPGQDATKVEVNLNGKVDSNVDYGMTLRKDNQPVNSDPQTILFDQAYFTVNDKMGTVQIGRFQNNPTIMGDDRDLMYYHSLQNIEAPLVFKVTPNMGKDIDLSGSFMPRSQTVINEDGKSVAEGAGAYQISADYKLPMATVGFTYQQLKVPGKAAGLVWQFQVQPVNYLKIDAEVGKESLTNNNAAVVGATFTAGKIAVRGEYDMKDENVLASNTQSWMGKVTYNFSKNLFADIKTGSKYTQSTAMEVGYRF